MKSLLKLTAVLFSLIVLFGFANKVQLNSTLFKSDTFISTKVNLQENPFENFKGEWVMKDDIFENTTGGKYKADVNPNRSFFIKELGTQNSVVWISDFDGFKVNIFWTYDFKKEQVHHLSMSDDVARGIGGFTENGDLELKLVYENSCESCYRIYSFQWKSEKEFFFRATFHEDGEPTGDFYGGTFIRKVQ